MIFSYQVKWVAEKYLREVLATVPSQLQYCLDDKKFPVWCRLCAERLTQMDIAGYVRSQAAAHHFVKVAVIAYAKHQIEKASLQFPESNKNTS